ncbi:transmembrane protease serine 12-like isoform X2 [Sceloporus undulatus]|uniref:transmembrane protease serine 12-like isoform X2 n=1 Tax=Sceloporus undulatus TaxID=8520 RepID=UPI001C4C4865|nr:transmembrane protease serine 12-like isoform X2 [Sceloporus undulatus]
MLLCGVRALPTRATPSLPASEGGDKEASSAQNDTKKPLRRGPWSRDAQRPMKGGSAAGRGGTESQPAAILSLRRTMRGRSLPAAFAFSFAFSSALLWLLLREAWAQRNVTQECGLRPAMGPGTGPRIVGGHDAHPGAWPWQVSLQFYEIGLGYIHLCGGSLITNISVVTAAHCTKASTNPDFWRVVIGLHHLHKYSSYTVNRRVNTITIHSKYNTDNYENDVALFKFVKPIKFSEYVQPICLPEQNSIEPSYPCFITGWGHTTEKGRGKLILQEAQVDIIPLNKCNRYNGYGGRLTSKMICAGSESGRVDSCQGDSGGPLMCYVPHAAKFYLVGITSFGYGCGRPKHPGVYVRLLSFRRWIDTRLRSKATTVSFQCFVTMGWVLFYAGL